MTTTDSNPTPPLPSVFPGIAAPSFMPSPFIPYLPLGSTIAHFACPTCTHWTHIFSMPLLHTFRPYIPCCITGPGPFPLIPSCCILPLVCGSFTHFLLAHSYLMLHIPCFVTTHPSTIMVGDLIIIVDLTLCLFCYTQFIFSFRIGYSPNLLLPYSSP